MPYSKHNISLSLAILFVYLLELNIRGILNLELFLKGALAEKKWQLLTICQQKK